MVCDILLQMTMHQSLSLFILLLDSQWAVLNKEAIQEI